MIFLCDLPDPIHGMSNVNKSMLNEAKRAGIQPRIINTVPSYAAVFFDGRLWLFLKFLHSIYCCFLLFYFLLTYSKSVIYRPINGGAGQFYDYIYVLITKLFRVDIIFHHHSFNYLNSYSKLFNSLQWLAGRETMHVVLGEVMGSKLCELYGIHPDQIHVLSNVAFFDGDSKPISNENSVIRIGHLANLCIEKGVSDFVDLCRDLSQKKVDYQAFIAGPFADDVSKEIVGKACLELSEIQYLGPLYGSEKDSFFKGLDVFVFPSRYCNEAEPLVLYEAGQFGVLNIGTNRGCMTSVIKSLGGLSFDETDALVSNISDAVQRLNNEGQLSSENKLKRLNLFIHAKHDASLSLQNLLRMMKNNVSEIK